MTEVPELWWLPASDELVIVREGMHHRYWAVSVFDDELDSARRWLPDLPDDAVQLAPPEPVDEKSRGEAYMRGHRDGQLAERAHARQVDPERDVHGTSTGELVVEQVLCQARIWPSWANKWVTCGSAIRSGRCVMHDHPAEEPPFAPELADAPLVTGESGSPAPLVVDQPVHDSTLPVELEEGRRIVTVQCRGCTTWLTGELGAGQLLICAACGKGNRP